MQGWYTHISRQQTALYCLLLLLLLLLLPGPLTKATQLWSSF
jgi:hypothetical protein